MYKVAVSVIGRYVFARAEKTRQTSLVLAVIFTQFEIEVDVLIESFRKLMNDSRFPTYLAPIITSGFLSGFSGQTSSSFRISR